MFHFDLRATLADPNPQIDLKIPIYEESAQSFLQAVNNYKNKSIAAITDKRARDAAEMKRLKEKTQKVAAETNKCKQLENEQAERKDAELAVSSFKRQIGSLHEHKGKERSTLNTHASWVTPELHAFENILACHVEGMQKEQLLIRFKCVDISDLNRDFCFILDVSGQNYRVIKTSPPVPSLPLLVDELNLTRDIFAFIVQIRQEFHRMANGEEIMNVSTRFGDTDRGQESPLAFKDPAFVFL
ncbi:hypothetical protein BT96DRAFT_954386 [Gymnopus androsaceus JB14]|uniref:Kinetochore protein SPC25 n=1 Tax=Gymnopus androsaceus JB14 TaxID=1447944 RepID=A0A6A4IAZ1_9AGAR|nr:hypothetical protein BT96DRAFT_954386 [Gymnopus androsaceus JB14]